MNHQQPEGSPPARQDQGSSITRREFVDYLLGTSVGVLGLGAVYPSLSYLAPPPASSAAAATVTLPFTAEELPRNSARMFKFGSSPGIVVRTPEGEIRAFGARCTHLACVVAYEPAATRFVCNCHGGCFDIDGRNISGPPPAPLRDLDVMLRRRPGGDGHEILVSAV